MRRGDPETMAFNSPLLPLHDFPHEETHKATSWLVMIRPRPRLPPPRPRSCSYHIQPRTAPSISLLCTERMFFSPFSDNLAILFNSLHFFPHAMYHHMNIVSFFFHISPIPIPTQSHSTSPSSHLGSPSFLSPTVLLSQYPTCVMRPVFLSISGSHLPWRLTLMFSLVGSPQCFRSV